MYWGSSFTRIHTQCTDNLSTDNLSQYCKKWNLTINLKKTKIVTFSKTGKIENTNHNIDGTNLEKATEYKYIGFV